MPNSSQHQAKYQANRQYLDTGNNGGPLSTLNGCWASVVAFYAALHLVDRLAARVNFHPGDHAERERFVSRDHSAIYRFYSALKSASIIARYGTINQFTNAYPGTTVQDNLIDTRLFAIENYVNNIFNPPAPPIPPAAASGVP
jgi:hypothetical protein